jgi:predicted transposase YdaD
MLDYSVRLKREYQVDVEQVVLFLQQTSAAVAFMDAYQDRTTCHRYRVIRLWEQDPEDFLTSPALLN